MATEWLKVFYIKDAEFNKPPLPSSWVVIPNPDLCWYAVLCDSTTRLPVDICDLPEVDE